jgi:hypothetical protein
VFYLFIVFFIFSPCSPLLSDPQDDKFHAESFELLLSLALFRVHAARLAESASSKEGKGLDWLARFSALLKSCASLLVKLHSKEVLVFAKVCLLWVLLPFPNVEGSACKHFNWRRPGFPADDFNITICWTS